MMTLPLRPAHRPAITLMAAAFFFFLLWLAAALKAETVVVINELKSDTPGPDVGEFIELYAYESTSGHAAAFFPLNGYLVVFFNGASPSRAAYQVTPAGGKPSAFISLDGKTTNAGGFFVIGSAAVTGSDVVLQSGSTGWLQNGADAIGLYKSPEIVFTTATGATATGLVDAVVYGTDDADDLELLAPRAAFSSMSHPTACTRSPASRTEDHRSRPAYSPLSPPPRAPPISPWPPCRSPLIPARSARDRF